MNNGRKPRSIIESRRPIKPVHLTQGGLRDEFENLQREGQYFIEFETKYLGDIPGVPMETDTTNRTEVLKIIDRGKKQGLIPLHLTLENDATLYLSKYVFKVNKRDGQEDMLLNLPLHEIAQLCYVKDEGLHILAIKHGTTERLNLAVLYCSSQSMAEGVCSLVSHCFHLVYTETMIDLIEETIDVTLNCENRSSSSDMTPNEPQFITSSVTNIPSLERTNHPTPSDISKESSQEDLLREYMWQLFDKLKPEELKKFSSLLKSWNYASNKLLEFCNELYRLFGQEKKYLLTGMFPFIPERDVPVFEDFLKSHNITLPGHGTFNSMHGYPPAIYTRSISDISIHSATAVSNDFDLSGNTEDSVMLDDISKNLERIALSVDDPGPKYLPMHNRNT